MSLAHLELLDKKRQKVFKKLAVYKKEAILAGGTALFLQICHRYSSDFDLFLPRKLKKEDFAKLKKTIGIKKIQLNNSNQITFLNPDEIKITLVFSEYKPLFRTVETSYLSLYAVKDIALDKAFTVGQRAMWRDYVDLFFILKDNYINLADMIKLSQEKFGVDFSPKLFVEQLVYFDDLKITPTRFIKEKYSKGQIKNFLKEQLRAFKNKNIIGM